MNRDILLAISLSFLVLLASRYFLEPYIIPVEPDPAVNQKRQPDPPQKTLLEKVRRPNLASLTAKYPKGKTAQKEQLYSVETDLFKVVISNRGAVVKEWVLKNYLDDSDAPLNLIDQSQAGDFPLALRIDTQPEVSSSLATALFHSESPLKVKLSQQGGARSRNLKFEYVAGRVRVLKKLTFTAGSYEAKVDSDVFIDGRPVEHFLLWQGGFGDATLKNTWAKRQVVYQGQEDITRLEVGDLESQQVMEGSFHFLGVEDHYFAAVFLPSTATEIRRIYMARDSGDAGEDGEEFFLKAGVYSSATEAGIRLFVGPKDVKILPDELGDLIDYGWFAFLCKPLFYGLTWIYSVVGNYGLAIMILTIVINAALFPLRYKSVVSSQKMQKVQPKMKAIQEKYKKLKPTDPKRQQMNSEMMALYKEHGVNPLGGCLPLLLQMPFLFAFYNLLNVAIELRQAPFFWWMQDLSAPDPPPWILPILMVASMVLMQKMTPMPSADPLQAKMMMFMPLIFGFMMAAQSSGLVLYWFTSNLVNILQQVGMNRYGPIARNKTEDRAPPRKGKKGKSRLSK